MKAYKQLDYIIHNELGVNKNQWSQKLIKKQQSFIKSQEFLTSSEGIHLLVSWIVIVLCTIFHG